MACVVVSHTEWYAARCMRWRRLHYIRFCAPLYGAYTFFYGSSPADAIRVQMKSSTETISPVEQTKKLGVEWEKTTTTTTTKTQQNTQSLIKFHLADAEPFAGTLKCLFAGWQTLVNIRRCFRVSVVLEFLQNIIRFRISLVRLITNEKQKWKKFKWIEL